VRARGIEFRLADVHDSVRDSLRRIGFEDEYGPLETGQIVDLVISAWQTSVVASERLARS